jgi:hypothetical protein
MFATRNPLSLSQNHLPGHNVQKVMSRGRKASNEFKGRFQHGQSHESLVTVGRYVEGVGQDFLLHSIDNPVSN